jgi:hypothetical protein
MDQNNHPFRETIPEKPHFGRDEQMGFYSRPRHTAREIPFKLNFLSFSWPKTIESQ